MKTISLVAGPCSAESRTQMLETARGLKEIGVGTLRAGLWKPRSRCGTFEGVGEEGLDWMREIQQKLGLRVMTEVALPCHVEAVRKAGLDMIWIGARTTVNPFMMHELAESLRGCDMPVWVKNPVCPDVDLWIGAVERLQQAGLKDIRITEGDQTGDERLDAGCKTAAMPPFGSWRNVFILIFLNCLSTVIRAISEENVNYWRLFARKPYLCTPTVCLSSRIAVRRKLFLMLPSN